jgi:hypothetical protein
MALLTRVVLMSLELKRRFTSKHAQHLPTIKLNSENSENMWGFKQ